MTLITSRTNANVKEVRALRQAKARQESGLFLVEGIRPVGEAVESGIRLQGLYYVPGELKSEYGLSLVRQVEDSGVPVYALTLDVFSKIADKDNPQGILAVARKPSIFLQSLTSAQFPWCVALVSPQDPGNIGTILRTIDATGASGLLLLETTADPYHSTAVRASMGAIFWHPVVQTSFSDFSEWAVKQGYSVYGTSAHASQEYTSIAAYQCPCVLLLGSERTGLTPAQAEICQAIVRLPMRGRATSLNLAVAAGVLLYDMMAKLQLSR